MKLLFLRVIPTLTHHSDIPSGSIYGIYIWHIYIAHIYIYMYSDILAGICSDILSGILSGIYSDILSSIYSDIFFWHPVWHSPGVPDSIWSWRCGVRRTRGKNKKRKRTWQVGKKSLDILLDMFYFPSHVECVNVCVRLTFRHFRHINIPDILRIFVKASLSSWLSGSAQAMLKQCMRALHSIWDLRWKLGPRAEGFWSPLEVVCPCLGAKIGTEASCWAMAHWNNALAAATTATTYPAPSNAPKALWKMQNGNKYHETSWNHVVTENGLEN